MSAPAEPFARRHPALEKEEPPGGPRQDRLGNELVAVPLVRRGIEEAESREFGARDVGVNVRREFSRAARIEPDDRGFHGDRNPGIRDLELGEEEPREVRHTHRIGSSNGRERSLPHSPKPDVADESEIRIQAPNLTVLLGDRQPHRHPPKNVCVGLARATLGATDRPATATGIRPEFGMTSPEPAGVVLPTRSK